MDRRGFLRASLGALAAPGRPNVVVILADDLGYSDVGCQGSEIRTPNIDRLAGEGVRFERAYSFPVCSPTRSGLMTGRSPMRLGVAYTVIRPWSNYGVPLRERFLPQAFQEAGYQTAITGKWHLGHSRKAFLPRARGFDHAYGQLNGAIDYYTHERERGLDWNRNGRSVKEEGYTTYLLGREACGFIRNRDKARPFLLYLPFNAPHAPLEAPPELIAKYAGIRDEKRRVYAAMTEAMDSMVGKVVGTLEEEGLAKNTLVLFFSDNGGPLGSGATNRPLRAGKGTTYEGGIRVPALMRWPGVLRAGAVSRQVISMMDYFPTLAAAAGVEPGNRLPFDGKNLWGAIRAGKVEAREDIFFVNEGGEGMTRLAVLHGEWKLVREVAKDGSAQNRLFRPGEDAGEKNDLAAGEPGLVAELTRRIEAWRGLHPADGVRESRMPAGWSAPPLWAEAAI